MKRLQGLYRSLTLAFAMYSRIPTPRVDWDAGAMAYVFCFFPLVGAVVGFCLWGWIALAALIRVGSLLFAAVAFLLPLLITGGIHLDGFCDTCDALGSHQSPTRKLEILKDSHIGAFAAIGLLGYSLLTVALWSEVEAVGRLVPVLALLPVLSRTLSGLCSLLLPNARGEGLLHTFTSATAQRRVLLVLVIWLVVDATTLVLTAPLYGVAVLLGAALSLGVFIPMAKREFGGITGDLAGWFLQICELTCLLLVVLVQKGVYLL